MTIELWMMIPIVCTVGVIAAVIQDAVEKHLAPWPVYTVSWMMMVIPAILTGISK